MIHEKALIITFHCCPNYGAVLQTYGLFMYLKKIFRDVEILDYRPHSLMKEYDYINTYSLASVAMSLWALPSFALKRNRFSKFIKQHLALSSNVVSDVNDLEMTDAHYCFVGSDQIWNPDITGGFDKVYFGDVPCTDKLIKVSYAASIGKQSLSTDELASIKKYLQDFTAISVREVSAQKMLQDYVSQKISVALDPTLLAGAECFRALIKPVHYSGYVFVYTLSQKPEETGRPLARRIAAEKNLKVIEISGGRKGVKSVGHKVIYDAGPAEFVSLLANAQYVVTDSFHGTAFSILFHRPFATFAHKTRGGRMVNLLSIAGLSNHLVEDTANNVMYEDIDWKGIEEKLSIARKESEAFICHTVNSERS